MASKGGAPDALFCDTNVFIRLLTGEPPEQAEAAARALDGAGDAKLPVVLTDLIVAEIAYVLTSVYELTVGEAAAHILAVMDLPAVRVADDTQLRDAIRIWAEGNVDFADAYLAAMNRLTRATGVLSFDRDFDGLHSVTRYDPFELPAAVSSWRPRPESE